MFKELCQLALGWITYWIYEIDSFLEKLKKDDDFR